jgi:Lon protease-like protein
MIHRIFNLPLSLILSYLAFYAFSITGLRIISKDSTIPRQSTRSLDMKWFFGKIPGATGSFKDFGGVGSQGELYYVPASKPTLKAPEHAVGKQITIPLFPRNQVLGPTGEDYLLIYEMRYRQLFNEVGDGGICGNIFYSPENSRIALVGTLSRVSKLERLDDGGMYIVLQGIGRFYVRDIVSEKPFLLAKVQIFYDYSENMELVESLERKVFDEIRYSVKIMKLLYPANNYTMNEGALKYQPAEQIENVRTVKLPSDVSELQRHSKFSFGTMEMLKTDPQTKLVFIQEHLLERRYAKMLKVGGICLIVCG